MEKETDGAAIKEFVRLKSKMYSFLVDDRSEYKKHMMLRKMFIVPINHNE